MWGRRLRRGGRVSRLPHVDRLLCRFSTERTVAWNIFRLCTWIRPADGEGADGRLSLRPWESESWAQGAAKVQHGGHTWQQLQALGLGAQSVPLTLPAALGAEYILGGCLGVLPHTERLTGGLRVSRRAEDPCHQGAP